MRKMPGFACRLPVVALRAAALSALLFVVAFESPAQEQQSASVSGLEALTYGRINAHRTAEGLPPFEYDTGIAKAARRHSEDMAAGTVPFGHEGFEARGRRITEAIPVNGMAENVGVNTYPLDGTVSAAVSGWLASPLHRGNIEGDFDVTGIGIAGGPNGAWFYTQIFVKRAQGHAPK